MYEATVVVAAYNAEQTLGAALRSLLAEDRVDIQVIVVDDGSTDRTAAVAQHALGDAGRVMRLTTNRGRSIARNTGINAAQSPLIAILDADDLNIPGRLRLQVDFLNRKHDTAVVSGRVLQFGPWGSPQEMNFPIREEDIQKQFNRGRMGLAHGAAMFRKTWFEKSGGYDPRLPLCEDLDLFLRGRQWGRYEALDAFLVEYRRPSRFVPWTYWWDNERHRRAAVNRSRRATALGVPAMTLPLRVRHDFALATLECARYGAFMALNARKR